MAERASTLSADQSAGALAAGARVGPAGRTRWWNSRSVRRFRRHGQTVACVRLQALHYVRRNVFASLVAAADLGQPSLFTPQADATGVPDVPQEQLAEEARIEGESTDAANIEDVKNASAT